MHFSPLHVNEVSSREAGKPPQSSLTLYYSELLIAFVVIAYCSLVIMRQLDCFDATACSNLANSNFLLEDMFLEVVYLVDLPFLGMNINTISFLSQMLQCY